MSTENDVIPRTNAAMPCPVCQCRIDAPSHAIVGALADDDLDGAMELGLLDADECPDCAAHCRALQHDARDQRQRALAARERYRVRNARLQQRASERAAKREVSAATPSPTEPAAPTALPSAAAAALARARAKAAARHKP